MDLLLTLAAKGGLARMYENSSFPKVEIFFRGIFSRLLL